MNKINELLNALKKTRKEHLNKMQEIPEKYYNPDYVWLKRHYLAYGYIIDFVQSFLEVPMESKAEQLKLLVKMLKDLNKGFERTRYHASIANSTGVHNNLINSISDKIFASEQAIKILTS